MNAKEILFFVLNKSPIMTVSCDELFGDYSSSYPARYSLISLGVGGVKIHLLTYCEGFNFLKVVSLDNIMSWPSQKEVDEKTEEFRQEINNTSDDELTLQREFLVNYIQDQNSSESNLQNKISTYTTILVLVVPAIFSGLVYVFSEKETITLWWAILILLAGLLYSSLNQIYFLYRAHNIKGRTRPTFSDLRANCNIRELVTSYYTHWISARREVQCIAGYIRNVEKYLQDILLFALALFALLNAQIFIRHSDVNKAPSSITEVSLLNKGGELQSNKLQSFLLLLQNAASQEGQAIYIINNVPENKEAYQRIRTVLDTFIEKDRIKVLNIKTPEEQGSLIIIKIGDE